MTPAVFNVPLFDVELHAEVYGERTASGIAGGRAGEYAGTVFLKSDQCRACILIPGSLTHSSL